MQPKLAFLDISGKLYLGALYISNMENLTQNHYLVTKEKFLTRLEVV